MEDETRGQAIRRRREAMGMSVRSLERESKLTAKTITKAEADDPATRDTTYGRLESILGRLEEEMGMDRPSDSLVTIRLESGGDIVVQGPVEDLDELEQMVERLMRRTRRRTSESENGR